MIDETPAAYKAIDAVMAAQADLVEVVHTLRQVLRQGLTGAVSASCRRASVDAAVAVEGVAAPVAVRVVGPGQKQRPDGDRG